MSDRLKAVSDVQTAYDRMTQTCEGRFGVLSAQLQKQTIRAETISVMGGLIGVLGTVATCPHCAAFASGLAGLANPLQQTFKENGDTPAQTIAALRELSDSIKSDFSAYLALPAPRIATDSDDDFTSKWGAQRNKLFAISSSCAFYTQAVLQVQNSGSSSTSGAGGNGASGTGGSGGGGSPGGTGGSTGTTGTGSSNNPGSSK